ncbi:MAG TPA: hypothetical protein VFB50_17740 [Chloroflexota bacterium]|nr:hypothetical protein [Chloroflexota bacterium]
MSLRHAPNGVIHRPRFYRRHGRPLQMATARPSGRDWLAFGLVGFGMGLAAVLCLALLLGGLWLIAEAIRHLHDLIVS